ncbi:hypothetical protein [Lentimicrobium sp. S6]|uniref:hypothetical protein n=1 Tax=Lentimicrobium sp. S6 TaxID=2735872 RepID=UPI0015562A7E|nr:hypothetical protein [Lentimicrobium sp. S6]NPD45780.1 hypothetical protein [Lentimicrobium sp. S6]
MKKILIVLLFAFSLFSYSQSVSDVFEYKAVTFYGLDFTHAKCVGLGEFPGGAEMVNYYYPTWNKMFSEGKKNIPIGAPYKKKRVEYDTAVYELNRMIPFDEIIQAENFIFKKSQIEGFIEKYSSSEKAGLGLVYMVESLNATNEYASIWVVFFDIGTGKVLISEPTRAEGKGRKFEDYWTSAIIRIYDTSRDDYKTWMKFYN